jgi:TonB family protein
MLKRPGQLGILATLTGVCFAGVLAASAQADEPAGYKPPHVDVSGGNMQPVYPSTAAFGAEQGSVVMQALVNSDGKVERMKLARSSGYDDLDNAALAAVMHWKFVPASRDGQFYEMPKWATVTVEFQLPNTAPASGH